MREIICTVNRSRGSKRRPKVMTAIGRTHPTSGSTRHTTAFSPKKRYECSVLLFYKHESHLTTASVLQLALLPRFSLLILNSADARWAGWVCSTAAPPHSENVTTGIKMPYTPSVPKYKPFQILISNGIQHTNVCRHSLECRFTHFAPYVVVTCWNLQKDLYLGTEGVLY